MKKHYTKTFLAENILQSLILIIYACIFFYAVLSKNFLFYVHARHSTIIIFASLIFIVISFFQIKKICFYNGTISQKVKTPFYLIIFVIPIILSFISSNKHLSFESLAFNADIYSQKQAEFKPLISNSKLLELQDGYIVMDDDTFGRWLSEIYLNLESWEGKKIKIEGAVWKNPDVFGKNEFALGRMMMVCCAADMQPAGLMASWDKAETLNEDDWVRITGVLSKIEYNGEFDPFIIAESVEKIKRPQFEYIYPF